MSMVLSLPVARRIWVVLAGALALGLSACGSDSPQAMVASGQALEAKGDRTGAIIQYKAALQANPELTEARLLLGRALLRASDAPGAVVEFNRARAAKADATVVLPLLAQALAQSGEYKRLIQDLGSVTLPDAKAQAEIATQLAFAWRGVGDRAKAESSLQKAVSLVPGYPPAQLQLARLEGSRGKLDASAQMADAILQADPKYADAWLLKGEILQAKGDTKGAGEAFDKALASDPALIPAHVAIVGLRIAGKDIEGAKKQQETLRSVASWHPAVTLIDAQLAYAQDDLPRARERIQKLLSVLPDNTTVLEFAGLVEARLDSVVQAAAHFRKALSLNPALEPSRLGLAQMQIRLGQSTDALETLKPLLEAPSPAASVLATAADAEMRAGNVSSADQYLRRASQADPQNVRLKTAQLVRRLASGDGLASLNDLEALAGSSKETYADEALFAARFNRGEFDAALATLDAMAKKSPGKAVHHELRGRVHLARRDFVAARAAFEAAVKADPGAFSAVIRLVALDTLEKKPEQAMARLQAVVTADPLHSVALIALAEMKARAGAPSAEVTKLLQDAAKASPLAAEPRLRLMDFAVRKRQFKQALTYAQEALAVLPNDLRVLEAAGKAQMQAGDLEQAASTFRRLAGQMPKSGVPYLRLAEVYRAQNKLESAEVAIKKSLELEPENAAAQGALVDVLMASNRPGSALEYVRRLKESRIVASQAQGYALEATYHTRLGKPEAALNALREGVNRTASADLAGTYFSLLIKNKRDAEAAKFGEAWMRQHPKDAAFDYLMSVRDITQGDYKTAQSRLLRVVEVYPTNAMALNNLSWVMVQTGTRGAIDYAQRAVDVLPDQPALMDTLALALAADKQFAKAIDVQRRALELAPDDNVLRLALARLAIQGGNKPLAREELERLQKLGAGFQGQGEVAKLMQQL